LGKKQLDFLKLKLGEIRVINNDIVNFSGQKKDAEKKLKESKKKLQNKFEDIDSDSRIFGLNSLEYSLNIMKKVELQSLLDSHDMSSKGNKPVLIRRLIESDILYEKFSYDDLKQQEKKLKDTKNETGLSGRKADFIDFKKNNNVHDVYLQKESVIIIIFSVITALWSIDYGTCLYPIILLGIGFLLWLRIIASGEQKYTIQLADLENKMKEAESKVSIVQLEYNFAKKMNEILSKKKRQEKELSELIQNLETDVTSFKQKLSKLDKKRSGLYAEISKLIPYSNLIE
jgi:hypothetical protein